MVKKKSWRKRIWRSGILRSYPIPQCKNPEYVGNQESPAYVIEASNISWILELLTYFVAMWNVVFRETYVKPLKEDEQFLWAGSEMDPVREMAKNLS